MSEREIHLMACGHVAQGYTNDGKPACVICTGIDKGAQIEVKPLPTLMNRKAVCSCGNTAKSSYRLPFFKYCPDKEYDEYYCGCRGWN